MSNETMDSNALRNVVEAGAGFGKSNIGKGQRVLVEFVSAQPNTVLTVTHGRGGVVGDVIAALLAATGYDIQREFYVNDSQESRPMRAFARAVLAGYRKRCGLRDATPETDGYNSEYVAIVADRIFEDVGENYSAMATSDALPVFHELAFARTRQDQRDVLDSLQIRFDNWTSESELARHGAVAATLTFLETTGKAEERGGALWLLSRQFGEPQDYVLRRADGTATYLAGDLAYHRAKFERGFDFLIDVWSADHSSYVSRTRAGLAAIGCDPSKLEIVVFERVRVLQDGTEIKGGRDNAQSSVALSELIDTIGADSARFQLAIEDPGTPLDLTLDASATEGKNGLSNIKRAIHTARELAVYNPGVHHSGTGSGADVASIADAILMYPAVVAKAAEDRAPEQIARYAASLAASLEPALAARTAHPQLYGAAAVALENALVLLGISPGPSVIEPNL